jgi:tryptophan-rich sensory protein
MKLKINHFLIPYLVLLVFIFGGVISSNGVVWYESLQLPSWGPSTALTALIWAVVYTGVAWAVLVLWNTTVRDVYFGKIVGVFVVTILVNLIWSASFFFFHQLSSSLWWALLLGACALVLVTMIVLRSKKAALLLLPYTAWVFFAAYLTHTVALLNP